MAGTPLSWLDAWEWPKTVARAHANKTYGPATGPVRSRPTPLPGGRSEPPRQVVEEVRLVTAGPRDVAVGPEQDGRGVHPGTGIDKVVYPVGPACDREPARPVQQESASLPHPFVQPPVG